MRLKLTVATVLLSGASGVSALEIDYSAERDPGLRACDAHLYSGNRGESDRCYGALLSSSEDARVRGEASWSLGDLQTANSYFQTAIEIYP
ncbi:MAG: hypothetical protein ACR2QQ_06880, partial [Gammaproteobacteria bacterium]